MNNVPFDMFKFATIQRTRIATGTDCTMLLGEIERLTTQVGDIQNALDDKDEELEMLTAVALKDLVDMLRSEGISEVNYKAALDVIANLG
jgi:hypothetical protein